MKRAPVPARPALVQGACDLALSGQLAASGKGAADPEDLVDDLLRLLKPH